MIRVNDLARHRPVATEPQRAGRSRVATCVCAHLHPRNRHASLHSSRYEMYKLVEDVTRPKTMAFYHNDWARAYLCLINRNLNTLKVSDWFVHSHDANILSN